MAAALAFAAPVVFFSGALGVMRDPAAADVTELALWFVWFGAVLCGALIVIGYLLQRRWAAGREGWLATLAGACVAAAIAEASNGRGAILVDQGVVQSVERMHAYALVVAVALGLCFFAHLKRSRDRENAAGRLAAAQTAQQEARLRVQQLRLQAVEARIDPCFLFEMLEAVRRAYERDSARAERLLDELVGFLREALSRLRRPTSNLAREAELAQACARLRALAGVSAARLSIAVSGSVADTRFPPGVLLPLLDEALRARAGTCVLAAVRSGNACKIAITLPTRPGRDSVDRARAALREAYGDQVKLMLHPGEGAATATFEVPYEPA